MKPITLRRIWRIYKRTILLALVLIGVCAAAVLWLNRLGVNAYPFEYTGNPGIPSLQTIIAGASTDEQAVERVLAYYDANTENIARILDEPHPDRLKALFAMFTVHISHNYGTRTAPSSLIEYLSGGTSHCGMYSRFQAQIVDAMGLTWRVFTHDIAEHAWLEVNIDDNWEIFDSTVNVWMNIDGYRLIAGEPRQVRQFYTPMLDVTRLDARLHLLEGWNMPRLRRLMPELGLTYNPPAPASEIGVNASVPGEGSDYNTPWYIWFDTQPADPDS